MPSPRSQLRERALLATLGMTGDGLAEALGGDSRLVEVTVALEREGLVARIDDGFRIA